MTRAEHDSLEVFLKASLTDEQRKNVLFVSFTQWDFALAALADTASHWGSSRGVGSQGRTKGSAGSEGRAAKPAAQSLGPRLTRGAEPGSGCDERGGREASGAFMTCNSKSCYRCGHG